MKKSKFASTFRLGFTPVFDRPLRTSTSDTNKHPRLITIAIAEPVAKVAGNFSIKAACGQATTLRTEILFNFTHGGSNS